MDINVGYIMEKQSNLTFCPRNKVLHNVLRDKLIDGVFLQEEGYIPEIIVHHVTCVTNKLLQLEVEMRHIDCRITFHRVELME